MSQASDAMEHLRNIWPDGGAWDYMELLDNLDNCVCSDYAAESNCFWTFKDGSVVSVDEVGNFAVK